MECRKHNDTSSVISILLMIGEDAFDDGVIDDALIWYCASDVLSPDPDTKPSCSHGARDEMFRVTTAHYHNMSPSILIFIKINDPHSHHND